MVFAPMLLFPNALDLGRVAPSKATSRIVYFLQRKTGKNEVPDFIDSRIKSMFSPNFTD